MSTHESYGSVVKNAFIWALTGIFLVILGFPVLYFNEKRQVHMDKIFDYASKIVKQNVTSDKVDFENEARLVHVQGTTATQETLQDNIFSISVTNCAKLERSVLMYQWVEHETTETRDTSDGGKDTITRYSYTMEWSAQSVNSSYFKETGYYNPPMPFESASYQASNVSLGAFQLSETLIRQMVKSCDLTQQELSPEVNAGGKQFTLGGGTYSTAQGAPQVGDMKVTFKKVPCGAATVLSVQHDDTFVALTYDMVPQPGFCSFGSVPLKVDLGSSAPLLGSSKSASIGLCSCIGAMIEARECLDDLEEGTLSARDMFDAAKSSQQCIHCGLHILGYILFFAGWAMQFAFVPTLFRIIPWIGLWIQSFGNFFAYIAAFLMACFCWCITVAYAWLALRPVKAVMLLTVAVAVILLPSYWASMNASPSY